MSKIETLDLRKFEILLGLLILVVLAATTLGGLFR